MQIFKNKSQEANNTEIVIPSKKRVSFCNFVKKRNSKGVVDIDIEPYVINDSDNRNLSSHENKTGCGFKNIFPRKSFFKKVRKPVTENFAAFETGFGK